MEDPKPSDIPNGQCHFPGECKYQIFAAAPAPQREDVAWMYVEEYRRLRDEVSRVRYEWAKASREADLLRSQLHSAVQKGNALKAENKALKEIRHNQGLNGLPIPTPNQPPRRISAVQIYATSVDLTDRVVPMRGIVEAAVEAAEIYE